MTARLRDEATLLIMAGTESTAKSSDIATFYLPWLPGVIAKLRTELTAAKTQFLTRDVSLTSSIALDT